MSKQLTEEATNKVRELIALRQLLPGEKVRQVELAQQIGISRSPLREALRTLASEGYLVYDANRGYVVARLSANDLSQVYRMRELLETELLLKLRMPTKAELRLLDQQIQDFEEAIGQGSIASMLNANRAFHFQLFALSDAMLIRREVERLWQLSERYRATYLALPETRDRVVREHREMVDAVKAGDLMQLADLSRKHRAASEEVVVSVFADNLPT